jgi:hypothetical protein
VGGPISESELSPNLSCFSLNEERWEMLCSKKADEEITIAVYSHKRRV